MPRYSVTLVRERTETCQVVVEADNPQQAGEKALERERSRGMQWEWTPSDEPCGDPYVSDDDDTEELEA